MRDRLRHLFEIDGHPLREVDRKIDDAGDHTEERITFETAAGETVRGIVIRPRSTAAVPTVLYIHAHGNRYDIGADELLTGRPALQGPLGVELAAAGMASLAIDMPGFGDRKTASESALAKARLWRGKSLAGQMLGEQASALDWLAEQPWADAGRIGVFGISMGATLGYWLAAVDPRIACVAHQCCYADFATLMETGAHDLHGIYLTIPGLLDVASNGAIAGLVAPRPQLICIGDLDPLTPPSAVDRALAETRAAYRALRVDEALVVHREAELGHSESAAMRRVTLDFLKRNLA